MNLILAEEVLNHIHNWFVVGSSVFQNVTISNGSLSEDVVSSIPSGAFYRLQGTLMNDGLHVMSDDGGYEHNELVDESVERLVVSTLAIPRPLIAIIDEIAEWEDKYGEVAKGPFFSESFGGYEYEIRGYSSYGAASSSMSGWRLAFANRLNPWRKAY